MHKTEDDFYRLGSITEHIPELRPIIRHCPVFDCHDHSISPSDFLYVKGYGYALIKLESNNCDLMTSPMQFKRKKWSENKVNISAVLISKNYNEKRPCLILSHGSGGNNQSEWQVAKRLIEKYNVNVLILDHFTQRGVVHTIEDQFQISIESQLIDVAKAVGYLEKLSFIDENKLIGIGVSRGGIVIDRLRRKKILSTLDIRPLAAHVCLYPLPYAQEAIPQLVDTPALYVIGEKDDITPLIVLEKYVEYLKNFGFESDVHIAPGAFHAFEYPGNWKLGLLNKFYKPTNNIYINNFVHSLAEKIFLPLGVTPMHRFQIMRKSCFIYDERGFLPLSEDCIVPEGMNVKAKKIPFTKLYDYVKSNVYYGGRVKQSDKKTIHNAYEALYKFLDKVIYN